MASKRYYAIRLGQAFFTIYAVVTLTFVLIRLMPGGPMLAVKQRIASNMAGGLTPENLERAERLTETFINVHPDKPIHIQYINFLERVAHGDLGESIWFREPVADIIATALPWTLLLMFTAIFLRFLLAVTVGATMAYLEGTKLDTFATSSFVVMSSIPYYIMALLLVFLLAYQYGIFPEGGHHPLGVTPGFNIEFIQGVIWHATLPILSVVISGTGLEAIEMRGNSIRVLGEDYLRVARLRGLPTRRIAISYVGRNAVLPMYTGLMISLGFVFGGSVILETIFIYPGMGYYFFQAVETRDYPLMMGTFMIIVIAVVVAIMIADLTYGKLDPRAGEEESREAY